jgi:hypothetical protein
VPLLWINLLRQLHGALHVCEQYGHLLSLALEGAAGGQNPPGKVLGRVGARVAVGPGTLDVPLG